MFSVDSLAKTPGRSIQLDAKFESYWQISRLGIKMDQHELNINRELIGAIYIVMSQNVHVGQKESSSNNWLCRDWTQDYNPYPLLLLH